MTKINIKTQILNSNDEVAKEIRVLFEKYHIKAFNIMASPGAGKTSLILALAKHFDPKFKIGVIEGDIASRIDTEKIIQAGFPAVQINTGGNCHLDAIMVRKVINQLPLDKINLLFIENVGNLICPANFDLGTSKNIVIASVPEGSDKPYKYPGMFTKADIVVLNKSDMIRVFDFDLDYFTHGVKIVNKKVPIVLTSCKNQEGIDELAKLLN
jgi:hydrogenase nickel incorporation protein HypB